MDFNVKRTIESLLKRWSSVDIQVVPGVMIQIRCGIDESDPDFELQFNWFIDASETPIHNHRHEFYSLCLEGEYTESLWHIVPAVCSDRIIRRFDRDAQKQTALVSEVLGKLEVKNTRKHFPGNILHVTPDQFHSIETSNVCNKRVLTLLRKRKVATHKSTSFLTYHDSIEDDKISMRPANPQERQNFYDKLILLV